MDSITAKKSNLPKVPLKSGVYFFLGARDEILYIGRATSLRKRLSNYFRLDLDPRIAEMVSLAQKIRWQTTENLLEAVILEANLIKKYWPKYNVKDKDQRSFSFIVFNFNTDFPYPQVVRGQELTKFPRAKYVFGPYTSSRLAHEVLKIGRRIFPYSTCQPGHGKPCFDRQIGLCAGVCTGEITKTAYLKNIRALILFLRGDKKRLWQKVQRENPDKLWQLENPADVTLIEDERRGILNLQRIEGYDISHLSGKETYGAMVVFLNDQPAKEEYRSFKIQTAKPGDDLGALSEVLRRRFNHPEWPYPDLVLIDGGRPQILAAQKVFQELQVKAPLVGISKWAGDALVFPAGTGENLKHLAAAGKKTLLQLREEAHRFANRGRMRGRKNYLR